MKWALELVVLQTAQGKTDWLQSIRMMKASLGYIGSFQESKKLTPEETQSKKDYLVLFRSLLTQHQECIESHCETPAVVQSLIDMSKDLATLLLKSMD